jgi:hypothetical protein
MNGSISTLITLTKVDLYKYSATRTSKFNIKIQNFSPSVSIFCIKIANIFVKNIKADVIYYRSSL